MDLNKTSINNEQIPAKVENDFETNSEGISAGIFLIRDGYICSCNPKFASLLGYRVDEIVNRKAIKDLIFAEDWDNLEQKLTLLQSSEINSSYEILRIIRNDKSLINVQVFLSKTTNEIKPAIFGKLVVIQEKEINNPEPSILAQAINNISESIILADLGLTIFFVNDSLQNVLGYSIEELVGKNVEVLFENCGKQSEFQEKLINSDEHNWQCELICHKKNGAHILIELKKTLIKDKNHNPSAVLFSIRDISEKDKVEGELRRKEYAYRNLFEQMHEAFAFVKIITDEQENFEGLTFLKVNKAFEKLSQMAERKLTGQNDLSQARFLENVEPDPLPIIAKVALNSTGEKFEVKMKDLNQWYSISVYSPEKTFAFILINDITKEKKAQEELNQSEIMLRSILDNIPQRVFWKDQDSNFLGCNIHFAKDVGIDNPSDIVGKSEFEVHPHELAENNIQTDKYIIENSKNINSEYEQQLKTDGKKIWVRQNKVPLKNKNDKTIGVVGTYEDISSQRDIEENLRKLSQAVEQSPASIVITDTDGNIDYVNPKFCFVTGYPFQEVIGKNPRILKSGEMTNDAYKKLWQKITSGKQWTGEFHNRKKNGELYWESASISPIKDKNGLITHFLAVKEDITERKKSDKALKESERVLRETQAIAGLGSYVLDITKGTWQSSKILDDIFGIDENFVHSVEGWLSLIHPDWGDTMAEYFSNDVLKHHGRFDKEYKIIRNGDGEERWVHGLGELEFDAQNNPIRMLGTISDITERKLTDEALNNSLSLLEGTLESTIDGILVVDQNGKIQRFNKKFLELWKIPESIIETRDDDAALNYVLGQLRSPDQFLNKVKELYKDTMAESIDLLEFKDGKIFERFSRPQLVGNKAVGRVWSFRDITDKKNAEQALIESEKKFRSVVEEAAEIVFTVDTKGYFTYINPAGLKSSGYNLDELKQLKYIDLIESNYKQRVKRNYLRQYLERSELSSTEYPILTKSGEIKWFNQNARLIIENDEVKGYYVIARDTTERRKVEDALRESEEKFRVLFETSTEGILVADANENIILVNPRMAEMIGYSADELIKMNFAQLILPEDLENHSLKHGIRKEGNSEIYERKLLRKDGSIIWTLVSAAPTMNKAGKYDGSFGMFTDITEQQKMMGELISAKDNAEEMNKLKSIFLANISHELRTPLIGIIGYAETLYNELDIPDFKEMAYTLLKSGTRLKETLNLILNLSHIEAGKINMILSPQNFTKLVRDKLKQFHLAAKDKGITLSIFFSKEDIMINADEMMLSQVIENLLANAIKYTNKGEIIIAISKINEKNKQFAQIKIQDTGIGIPKERVKLIFEPFRQASEGLSRSFEGIGLGLTVSKKFIELMGGEIFVESDVDKGSTFIVSFPVIMQSTPSSTLMGSAGINPITNSKENKFKYFSEILLIEDDIPTADIVRFYLSETCKTDWAANGVKAIEMAGKNNYSIILVDINLGIGMDGIETINKIKEFSRYKSVPIVAVTAYALYGDKEKFLKLGCDYYISKPFDKCDLVDLVDNLLALKQ